MKAKEYALKIHDFIKEGQSNEEKDLALEKFVKQCLIDYLEYGHSIIKLRNLKGDCSSVFQEICDNWDSMAGHVNKILGDSYLKSGGFRAFITKEFEQQNIFLKLR